MNYPITDSVLRRHYEQHLSAGGAELAGVSLDGGGATAGYSRDSGSASYNDAPGGGSSSVTGGAPVVDAPEPVSSGGGMMKMLLPLLVLLGLGWLGYKFLGGAEAPDMPETDVSMSMPAVDIDGMNVGDEISGIFSGATEAVSGITDLDSAKAAVPALTDITGKVDGLSGLWDKIPEASRGPMSGLIGDNVGKLTPLLDKASEIPGVSDVLGPVTGPLLEKLKGLM